MIWIYKTIITLLFLSFKAMDKVPDSSKYYHHTNPCTTHDNKMQNKNSKSTIRLTAYNQPLKNKPLENKLESIAPKRALTLKPEGHWNTKSTKSEKY